MTGNVAAIWEFLEMSLKGRSDTVAGSGSGHGLGWHLDSCGDH
jgi:hypothetical protein